MKDKQLSAVRLTQRSSHARQTLRMRMGALLPLIVLSAGFSLWLRAAFPSLPLPWFVFAPILFTVGAALLLCCGTRAEKFVLPAVLLCGAATVAGFPKPFAALINDFYAALQHTSGHIYLHFETGGSMAPVVFASVCISAVLLAYAAYSGSPFPLLPILVLMVEGAVSAVVPFGVGTALFAAGFVLLYRRQGLSLRGMLGRTGAAAVCVLLAVCIAVPLRDLPDNKVYPALREAMHGLVYDSRTNAMPEGKLTQLDALDKNETPALRVTLETPQKLYLRGHIYETYTGSGWKSLSAGTRDGYAQLFYWLHDAQYYGQTQIASAMREAGEAVRQNITVENLSACRAHGYLPYGAYGVPMDETLIGDADMPIAQSFALYADDADTLRRVQTEMTEHETEHAQYLRLEQAYADYARKVDLSIPDAARAVLDREFSAWVPSSGSLSAIRTAIREYLDETLTYDEQAGGTDKKTDFLQLLLEDTKCGYSVHYATAAVLLLRYCGVPARYAEGYYLPDGQQGEVTLTEANAHAWAELYLDGVGFVPCEVTPGYAGEETPQPDGERNTAHTPPSPASAPFNAPPETVQPEQIEEEIAPSLWWIWVICAAIVLLLALWVVLRRRRLRGALKAIDALPPREAVLRRYGYVKFLRRYAPQTISDTREIAQIVDLAQFSDHAITDEQRGLMDRFAADVAQTCLRQWNMPRRLYYRYIRCIVL